MNLFTTLTIAAFLWISLGCRTTTEELVVVPDLSQAPITSKTQFASKCPHCADLNISRSCQVSGSTTVQDGYIQQWNILYHCRDCDMSYSDTREQVVRKVESLRLPTRDDLPRGVVPLLVR